MPISITAPAQAPSSQHDRKRQRRDSSPSSDGVDMDVDLDLNSSNPSSTHRALLTPGAHLTSDPQFMRGHGTFHPSTSEFSISSSVLGTLHRTNKLLSISALRGRYTPEIGDLVVGRVVEVQSRRWRIDIGAAVMASLPLSAVNLPGGALRRRTGLDELAMRAFLEEGDAVLAEVQSLFSDGGAALHARSLKYGKLRNGVAVVAGARQRAGSGAAVKRSNRHVFAVSTRAGPVEVLLGVNGTVFVAAPTVAGQAGLAQGAGLGVGGEMAEEAARAMYSTQNDELAPQLRRAIGCVASCVRLLADEGVRVDEDAVRRCYEEACEAELEAADGQNGWYLGGDRGKAVVRTVLAAKG